MHEEGLRLDIKGHVKIVDDLGNVLVNQNNAIHPQNIARVIARALSNESNYYINRIAFGNGGTTIDAAYTITYNTVNDGQPPDPNTWDSRLYYETYSEIINEGNTVNNPLLGSDPGSAGPNEGQRPGGGSVPLNDPPSIRHISGPGVRSVEDGIISRVIVTAVLNGSEPTGQYLSDIVSPTENTESDFTFDELGLYTTGAPAIASVGYQDVNIGNKTAIDNSGLLAGQTYDFLITVDPPTGVPQTVQFTVPTSGGSGPAGEILYGDIVRALMSGDATWTVIVDGSPVVGAAFLGVSATVSITNDGTFDPSVAAAQTYGFLRFSSATQGITSTISLSSGTINNLFTALNPPGGGLLHASVGGMNAGVQNNPVSPETERERLLTHLIFSPVLKSANRTLTILYTLTISVARSP